MDARAGDLTAGEQAGHGGAAPGVGEDAAHDVVRRRRDGHRLPGDVQFVLEAVAVDAGEAGGDELGVAVGDVQQDVVAVGALHLRGDGAGDDVAGCEFGLGVVVRHEAAAVEGAEDRALSPHRFGDQEGRQLRQAEGGGMELDELQILHGRSGAEGQGDAVAGGDLRVGGEGIEPAGPAGGEDGPVGGDGEGFTDGGSRDCAAAAAVLDQQIDRGVAVEDVDTGFGDAAHHHRFDSVAGAVAAGVEDPGGGVGGLPAEGHGGLAAEGTLGGVEGDAQFDQAADAVGGFFHQDADDGGVAEARAGAQGVVEVRGRGCRRGRRRRRCRPARTWCWTR